MAQVNLAVVLLKLLGVFCVVRALEHLSVVFFPWTWGAPFLSRLGMFAGAAAPAVVLLIAAAALFRYAESVARRLFPEDKPLPIQAGAPTNQWLILALMVVGVVLLVWQVPANLSQIIVNFAITDVPGDSTIVDNAHRRGWMLLIRTVLQVGAGLYLVLGSRHLAAFLDRYAHRGGSVDR